MKSVVRAGLAAMALSVISAPAFAQVMDMSKLKTTVEGMGYVTNVISTGETVTKFEVTVKTADFDVPIAFEISPSTRYVWLTAFLGENKLTGDQALAMLKRTASNQPTHVWITEKGNLMTGIAMDNRAITPVELKFAIEKLSADVNSSSDIWNAG